MTTERPLKVVFFRTGAGHEPVREWLKDLPKEDCQTIGSDILPCSMRGPLESPWWTIWVEAFGKFVRG
jgi:hypothetical protein